MAKPQYALQWWDALIGALAEQIGAEHIERISNGSGVDNDFAYAVWQALSPKYPGLSVCTSIESPADLIQRIGNYKALAAYRMHATVVAMALDVPVRSEEHTSELQSLMRISYAVFCLKKKKKRKEQSRRIRRTENIRVIRE